MQYSSLKCSGMACVKQGITRFYLPPTRLSMNGINHPAFTSQLQSITALWPPFISSPTEGWRLSWPGWLVAYQYGMPVFRIWSCHSSQYYPGSAYSNFIGMPNTVAAMPDYQRFVYIKWRYINTLSFLSFPFLCRF